MTEHPNNPRAISFNIDAVVVGAGFAGLYMLYRLRQHGLSAIVIETGDDVGGTWYWNNYPGARCDVESMQYSFSFDDDLQQEWVWSERYSGQKEIAAYLSHVADRFDLRKDIRFSTTVTAASFDAEASGWTITTDRGDSFRARFCIMATGCLSASRMPDIEGIDDFEGRVFHTGRWPKDPVSLDGRRVGVVGTGSSGIQVISAIAPVVDKLTVFQRTPNFSIPAWNKPLADQDQAAFKADYPELRKAARNTRSGALYDYAKVGTFDVSDEERLAEYERRWQRGGANFTHCYTDVFTDPKANEQLANFVRAKIAQIVKDPETARILTPTDHAIGTKRICVDTDYYQTFNRENVELVNLRETPITRLTRTGIETSGNHYELDDVIFATGFDAVTGALARIDIKGLGGQTLLDKWQYGPTSYLGLMVAGFPNMFIVTGPGSPSILTNVVTSIEQHVNWIADCLAAMRDRSATLIDADPIAEEQWVAHVSEVAGKTLFVQAKSWYMGANVPGKPQVFLPYIGGLHNYTRICEDIVSDNYRGFVFS